MMMMNEIDAAVFFNVTAKKTVKNENDLMGRLNINMNTFQRSNH